MHFSAADKILWAVGFVSTALLLAVLLARSRWREFPVFTAYAAFGVTRTIALFFIYSHGWRTLYAAVYWSALLLDFALQLGIAVEIARIVLRPTGTWVHDARNQFLVAAATGGSMPVGDAGHVTVK